MYYKYYKRSRIFVILDLDKKAKAMRVAIGVLKIGALLILLFFFVCSLDLLSSAFRLVGGRTTGTAFFEGIMAFDYNAFFRLRLLGLLPNYYCT